MSDNVREVEWADPTGAAPLGGTIYQIPNVAALYVFTTTDDFASISAGTFKGHLAGGTAVICVCADATRTVILGPGGALTNAVYPPPS